MRWKPLGPSVGRTCRGASWRALVLACIAVAQIAWIAPARAQAPVRAAVAANLRDAFLEISAEFERAHPGMRVEPVFTSSGSAYQQILQGAPFDLFLSADTGFPAALDEKGYAEPGTRQIYARGRLALWIANRVPGQGGLPSLAHRRVRRIAVANPETAPYGRAAVEVLSAAGLLDRVRPKLVYGQDVGQTAQMALAAADAAFLPVSYLRKPRFTGMGRVIALDAESYAPLDQAYAVVRGRGRPEVMALFRYLQSPEAKAILRQHGYDTP